MVFGNPIYRTPDNSSFYVCNVKDIFNKTKSWSLNRPFDESKICSLIEYFENNQNITFIDGIILINFIPEEGYVRFDGNHRIEAGNKVKRDLLALIQVFELNDIELREKFKAINLSSPCPDFYTDNNVIMYRIIASDVVDHYLNKYEKDIKSFFSPGERFNKPNTNRDVFKGKIIDYLKENPVDEFGFPYTPEYLIYKLNSYHEYIIPLYKNKTLKIKSKTANDKCEKHNFYLFVDTDFVEKALTFQSN